MPPSFDGKVCLVTGGGSGIGLATVVGLLKANAAQVVMASRKEARLKEAIDVALAHCSQMGMEKSAVAPRLSYEVLNIRDEASVTQCLTNVMSKHGSIDVLINNGGGQFASAAKDIRLKGWKAVIDTNLNGTWMMTRTAFDLTEEQRMEKGRQLSIVTVTVDNVRGFPNMIHTGAARAGIENFHMTLASEWGPHNVRLNTVAPGIIFSSGVDNYPEMVQPAFVAAGNKVPLGRGGSETECATAILFLASPEAAYITGASITVDGGWSLSQPILDLSGMSGDQTKATPAASFHYNKSLEEAYEKRRKMDSKL